MTSASKTTTSHPICGSEFCFCKKDETLDEATARLKQLRVIV